MSQRTHFVIAAALAVLASLAVACGDDVPSDAAAAAGSAGSAGSGGAAGQAGAGGACSTKPTTHVEIINACTDAQAIDVSPVLPLLQPGGTLPPLP